MPSEPGPTDFADSAASDHPGVVLKRLATVRAACAALLLLSLPPWLALFLPSALPGGDAAWYTSHRTGKLG